MKRDIVLGGLLLMATFLAGCAGCSGSQGAYGGSVGQQGVCNQQDHFSYGVQGVKSGSESYTWQNGGNAASVQWGGQGSGSFTVSITDAAGKSVFSQSFNGGQQGAQQTTASGQSGAWRIDLSFSSFSGQGGLSINRA